MPNPFSHLRVYALRPGKTPLCPTCGGADIQFVAYYGDLHRSLMRCGCGELFVLTSADEPVTAHPARASFRALVLEPHPDTRELYSAVLTHYGASVKSFATADEALLAIPTWHPSVVSTELRLPDGDGLDFCRQLRSLPDSSAVSIAVITGETRTERLAAARDVADLVLVKPCSVEEYVIQVMLLARNADRPRIPYAPSEK